MTRGSLWAVWGMFMIGFGWWQAYAAVSFEQLAYVVPMFERLTIVYGAMYICNSAFMWVFISFLV